ncbi:MAG: hypothetical protein JNK05_33655 [Myxococcales bacterium]|nr:hypothetical protein [Myxococcales bacterium]
MPTTAPYDAFLQACDEMHRRRDRVAKPVLEALIQRHVGPELPSEDLLSHIIAESLLTRLDRKLVEAKNIYLQTFDIPQIELFYRMCESYPQVPAAHRVANGYLLDALTQCRDATLFEIGIGRGVQVASLITELQRAPGHLRTLRVLALDPDATNLENAKARIEALPKGPIAVSFHRVHAMLESLSPAQLAQLATDAGGNVVVNSAYTLHHTVHKPNDTELRTNLLRRIAQFFRPQLFTLVEPNADHDTEALARRVDACFKHFGAVFDLIDRSDIPSEHKFVVKEKFFGREIRDIFGVSDAYRCERHEHYESWLFRFAKSEWTPYPRVLDHGLALPAYCSVESSPGLVRLGYKQQPLIAVFAFESRGARTGAEQ